jgi:DNA-3-methyladenine glycosylase
MKDKLTRSFYSRNPLKVAQDLLGKYLVHKSRKGIMVGKIVETEAYLGSDDPACHTYQGKITERNKILFAQPGHAYVYTIYGMYYCFNVVAHEKGKSGGVFIRAVEPITGIELIPSLTNGPSKLCIAFGINKSLNGTDLCGNELFITNGEDIPDSEIAWTPRINIDYAGKAKNWPYRFVIKENVFLSRK